MISVLEILTFWLQYQQLQEIFGKHHICTGYRALWLERTHQWKPLNKPQLNDLRLHPLVSRAFSASGDGGGQGRCQQEGLLAQAWSNALFV